MLLATILYAQGFALCDVDAACISGGKRAAFVVFLA